MESPFAALRRGKSSTPKPWPATGRTLANTGDDRFPLFYGGPRLEDLLENWFSPFYIGDRPEGFLDRYEALVAREPWHEPSEEEIEAARVHSWRRFGAYAGNWPDNVNLETEWAATPRGYAIHLQLINTLTEMESTNVH